MLAEIIPSSAEAASVKNKYILEHGRHCNSVNQTYSYGNSNHNPNSIFVFFFSFSFLRFLSYEISLNSCITSFYSFNFFYL